MVSLKVRKRRSMRPLVQGVSGEGEGVLDAELGEEELEALGAEDHAVVGEDAVRDAVLADRVGEDAPDLGGGGPGEAAQSDEAAAVVVDDAQQPDGEEAEDPDEGEVEAPEAAGAGDVDAHHGLLHADWRIAEVGAAAQDLADGLACGGEAEGALGEEAELAGAEVGLLEVEADEGALEVIGSAIPGATVGWEGHGLREGGPNEEAVAEAAKGAAKTGRAEAEGGAVGLEEQSEA
jgi:hypothetical protein